MKFSIIVPVYNSANFLSDCLACVKNQSFDDWELIFIDDGSTDGSGTILDGYARSDDRIHVFHQENSGQFFAREKGFSPHNSCDCFRFSFILRTAFGIKVIYYNYCLSVFRLDTYPA